MKVEHKNGILFHHKNELSPSQTDYSVYIQREKTLADLFFEQREYREERPYFDN